MISRKGEGATAYIKRDIETLVLDTSKEYAGIMLTSPRQVGKTTMLQQLMDDSRRYVTLDDMDERKMAKEDPALFLSLHPVPVLIDEVQYAPELFSYIKIAIDNGAAPGAFWLPGRNPSVLWNWHRSPLRDGLLFSI